MADFSINLLDLPDLVLEEIFSYCLRYLGELKESCCFVKDFIETHPRLKKPERNCMRLEFIFKDVKRDYIQAKLQKYYSSNEIFDSIYIHCEYDDYFDNPESYESDVAMSDSENESDITVEMVVMKHAKFIEDFTVRFDTISVKTIAETLKLAKHLKSLVKCTMEVENNDNDWGILLGNSYEDLRLLEVESYSFPKLKELDFCADLVLPITIFGHCKTIGKITVAIANFTEETQKICKIMENSKSALKELNLHSIDGYDSRVSLTTFFNSASKFGLNLEKISIFMSHRFVNRMVEINKVSSICEFLNTQRKLTELSIDAPFSHCFFVSFKDTLTKLENLKSLQLHFDELKPNNSYHFSQAHPNLIYPDFEELQPDFINPEFDESLRWNLSSVEKINVWLFGQKQHTLNYIFGLPSVNLKEIVLLFHKYVLADGEFEKVVRNYQLLTKFTLYHICRDNDYSSNEIFHILKHLKKLQFLHFDFPKDRSLDITKFDDSQNLSLPEIEEVHLAFNDSITNDHLQKLMPLLKNVSKFRFESWKNTNDESYDIITRELTKLTYLNFGFFWRNTDAPTLKALNLMKDNIAKFNTDPAKFDYGNIEHEIKRKEEIENEPTF